MKRLTIKASSGLIHLEDGKESTMNMAIKKLSEYEDLDEQGRMLKLPCAVGDTVYAINTLPRSGKKIIVKLEADTFFCALSVIENRFGKTVFLTQKEAEAAFQTAEM